MTDNHEPDLSDGVPDADGKALPAGLCYRCQRPADAHRPAPDAREDRDWLAVLIETAQDALDNDGGYLAADERQQIADAVTTARAVVRSEPGQVSAEGAWDEGYRQGIADERTSQAWQTGDGPNRENPYRAVTDTTDGGA